MLKASDLRGFLWGLLIVAAIGVVVVWRVVGHRPPAPQAAPPPPPAASAAGDCRAAGWDAAAARNAASGEAMAWAPFGLPERGWATYGPLVAREVGAGCGIGTTGFAAALSRWQAAHGRPADGVFRAEDFEPMRVALMLRRPFVRATGEGACPAAATDVELAAARVDEAYGGKPVRLRSGALAAYRRMVAAARAAGVGRRAPQLQLMSGFRGPEEEARRCAEGGCDTISRARCSAHRTGLALDLYLDPAPGYDPASSAEANRRHMAQGPAYRWLVAHAAAFGFLPYAYEPWHWEWTGEEP